jgi:ABC-type methionine transport system ATPase subunit
MKEIQRYWLTYAGDLATRPIVWELSKQFELVFNIKSASVKRDLGIMALELEGERATIQQAVSWLESIGVQVEPVEINTIEG